MSQCQDTAEEEAHLTSHLPKNAAEQHQQHHHQSTNRRPRCSSRPVKKPLALEPRHRPSRWSADVSLADLPVRRQAGLQAGKTLFSAEKWGGQAGSEPLYTGSVTGQRTGDLRPPHGPDSGQMAGCLPSLSAPGLRRVRVDLTTGKLFPPNAIFCASKPPLFIP